VHPKQVQKLERLEIAFTVAKSHEGTHQAKYQAAKRELAAYRIKLRREKAAPDGPGDATAKPKTLQASTKPQKTQEQ